VGQNAHAMHRLVKITGAKCGVKAVGDSGGGEEGCLGRYRMGALEEKKQETTCKRYDLPGIKNSRGGKESQ